MPFKNKAFRHNYHRKFGLFLLDGLLARQLADVKTSIPLPPRIQAILVDLESASIDLEELDFLGECGRLGQTARRHSQGFLHQEDSSQVPSQH